jgi:hypothetical protein
MELHCVRELLRRDSYFSSHCDRLVTIVRSAVIFSSTP